MSFGVDSGFISAETAEETALETLTAGGEVAGKFSRESQGQKVNHAKNGANVARVSREQDAGT
ncbi:MAG TPA: hypothetical protein VNQ76_09065 [Planctomicrobium sp.]|nr:hypothetical protein [Planctomicrobium sp.]